MCLLEFGQRPQKGGVNKPLAPSGCFVSGRDRASIDNRGQIGKSLVRHEERIIMCNESCHLFGIR